MRFISMVKFAEGTAVPPPKAFIDAMDELAKEAAEAGCVMVEAGGLLATSMGRASGLPEAR